MSQGMPVPSDAHRRLSEALAGTWEGEETLAPSPWGPGGPAKGRYVMRAACDGFFVVQDYEEVKDGRVTFRGHGVLGYDPPAGEYTWYWVDSMGAVPAAPSRGRWDGDTITFLSRSPQGTGRYLLRFDGPDQLHFRLENCFDGQTFVELMRGDYRRVAR